MIKCICCHLNEIDMSAPAEKSLLCPSCATRGFIEFFRHHHFIEQENLNKLDITKVISGMGKTVNFERKDMEDNF